MLGNIKVGIQLGTCLEEMAPSTKKASERVMSETAVTMKHQAAQLQQLMSFFKLRAESAMR